jgi:hypothetical protein
MLIDIFPSDRMKIRHRTFLPRRSTWDAAQTHMPRPGSDAGMTYLCLGEKEGIIDCCKNVMTPVQ